MEFIFSKYGLKGKEKILQRFFEIVPGFLSWIIILGMLILSFAMPLLAAVIIIAFDLYWLLRLLYLTLFLVLSYAKLSKENNTDWMAKIKALDESNKGLPKSDSIYQLVIVPIAKETQDIVEPGIKSIIKGTFPAKKVIVSLALEGRATDEVKKGAENIKNEYKKYFYDLIVSIHKDGIQGEAKVKGANATNAAREMTEYLKRRNIPYENVIVSCFDSDTVVKPNYFACLTHAYMITPNRTLSSFQPIPVFTIISGRFPGLQGCLRQDPRFSS